MNALVLDYLVALYRRHGSRSSERRAEKIAAHRRQRYGKPPTKRERDALGRFMARRHQWARGQ
jgi:hypothetical protein